MTKTEPSLLSPAQIENTVLRETSSKNQIIMISHLVSFFLLILTLYFGSRFFFYHYLSENPTTYDIVNVFVNKIEALVGLLIYAHWFILYYFQFPFIEQFKDNNLPWPWHGDKEVWKKQLKDAILSNVINALLIFPPTLYFMMHFFRPITDPNQSPSFGTFIFHSFLMLFIGDFFFYWFHRLLHTPLMYKLIHKKHHSHYNIFNLSAIHTHWLEFILGNLMPTYLGMVILNGHLHLTTLNSFMVFRLIETNEGHSGYNFPWSPFKIFPFSTDSTYHNFHHVKNMGNYGDFMTIWDTIFKTNEDYHKLIDKSDEKTKKIVKTNLFN